MPDADDLGERRSRRTLRIIVAVLALTSAAGIGWWSARVTLQSSVEDAKNTDVEAVWATVTHSAIGRSLPLSTTLRQPSHVIAENALSGVVTAVAPGEVKVGDIAYSVNEVPVRVVEGKLPFYRDLSEGAHGEDVAQLQNALIALGHLSGTADGFFGPVTDAAVQEWQIALGRPDTGVVPLGELVAAPSLPTEVQLGDAIGLGRSVSRGEEGILAPTGDRDFVLVVTEKQARLIPAEATVDVHWQQLTWTAVIAGSTHDEFGNIEFELLAPDGGEVCGSDCGSLPTASHLTLRSDVIVIPRTEGPAVPAAAIRTRADGTMYVATRDREIDVAVLGSGTGIAIVDGVTVGEVVEVFGTAAGARIDDHGIEQGGA